jgi:hypothetical protein
MLVAVETGYAGVARRRRFTTIAVASAAAIMLVAVAGGRILDALGYSLHAGAPTAHQTLGEPGGAGPVVELYEKTRKQDTAPGQATGMEKRPDMTAPAGLIESTAAALTGVLAPAHALGA